MFEYESLVLIFTIVTRLTTAFPIPINFSTTPRTFSRYKINIAEKSGEGMIRNFQTTDRKVRFFFRSEFRNGWPGYHWHCMQFQTSSRPSSITCSQWQSPGYDVGAFVVNGSKWAFSIRDIFFPLEGTKNPLSQPNNTDFLFFCKW